MASETKRNEAPNQCAPATRHVISALLVVASLLCLFVIAWFGSFKGVHFTEAAGRETVGLLLVCAALMLPHSRFSFFEDATKREPIWRPAFWRVSCLTRTSSRYILPLPERVCRPIHRAYFRKRFEESFHWHHQVRGYSDYWPIQCG